MTIVGYPFRAIALASLLLIAGLAAQSGAQQRVGVDSAVNPVATGIPPGGAPRRLVLGQEVARQLGVRFIFVEKEDGKLVLRRGFKILPGERILVVEDVVTRGGRVQETIDIVRANGGQTLGVAMAVDRSGGTSHARRFLQLTPEAIPPLCPPEP